MENEFVAFIKGSQKTRTKFRLGIVVRRKGSLENFYAYREETKVADGTSPREEYRAIALAVKSVPYGSHLVIYTNNITAVRVFNGEWKAKKHKDILEDFHNSCFNRDVEVRHPNEDATNSLVALGMEEAEKYCYNKILQLV